ncbi:MAG: hypothetical protein FGM55_15120 [Rhodoferax sp.]|nr:hypothetical protein [Rhodoferax sp.]
MRLRLFLRRLTVSAPRMAVRSAMPWPLRWVVLALALGFCGAIALWAFEFGKSIAGLDSVSRDRLAQARAEAQSLRDQLASTRAERDSAQSVANTASTQLTAEKSVQESLLARNKQLEAENRSLRDDLGFFEQLIPSTAGGGLAIRGLQAEARSPRQIHWQVLVIQQVKNPPEFNGRLEISFNGVQRGAPWSMVLPGGGQPLKLRQYGRLEGVFDLPEQTVVRGVTARVMDGSAVKAVQTLRL